MRHLSRKSSIQISKRYLNTHRGTESVPHAKNQSRYGKRTSHTKVNRGICRIPRDTILIPLITQCIPLFDKIKICVQHIISVILLPQHSFRYGKRTSRTKANRGICCIPREIASRHLPHKEGKRTKLVARRRSHATLVAQKLNLDIQKILSKRE